MEQSIVHWGAFLALVIGLLLIDLLVFHRRPHTVTTKEGLIWTGVWVGLAMGFNAIIFAYWRELGLGPDAGLQFLTGYLIEEALSVDNMFVFLVIFRYFAVPPNLQHRVLFWGILGALVMRGLFIGVGAILVERFEFIIYIFGAFLIYTGWRLWKERGEEYRIDTNRIVRWGRKNLPLTDAYVGQRFFVRRGERLLVTPLFLVLLTIEFTDLVFAVDSIPAIFGITDDPFIVFTSNIFAVAGLRALYFVLSGIVDQFHYLQDGLALVLTFVGTKMLIGHFYPIPTVVSLAVVALLIGGSVVLSILNPQPAAPELPPEIPPFEAVSLDDIPPDPDADSQS